MYYLKRIQYIRKYSGEQDEEGTLFVTDSSEAAEKLIAGGCAVLVCLHEGNRNEDFSFCRYACEGSLDLMPQPDSLSGSGMDYLERVYRRYRGLPWDILETRRCLVRETTVEDVEDFYRIYADASVTKYMEPLYEDAERERAYARDYIDQVYAFYQFGMWTVTEKATGEVIGRAGICYRDGCELPELGFVIAPDRQGRGIATEVCGAILRYGYEEHGFGRILAFVRPGNAASCRVCDKLGMKRMETIVLQGQEYMVYLWLGDEQRQDEIFKD